MKPPTNIVFNTTTTILYAADDTSHELFGSLTAILAKLTFPILAVSAMLASFSEE